MDDVLFELCNQEKLNEVIKSTNIPFDPLKDDIDWYNNINVMLKKYSEQYLNKNNRRAIRYRRKYLDIGRFYSTLGIQHFPKDVRSYVCGEYYIDIDIVNCHPTILYHLFKRYKIATNLFLILLFKT